MAAPKLILLAGVTLGCADTPSGVSGPMPKSTANTEVVYVGGVQHMSYPSVEEALSSTGPAKISRTSPSVYWSGQYAFGSAEMDYYGNRAEIRNELKVFSSKGTYATVPLNADRNTLFDWWYTAKVDQQSSYSPDICGFVAQVSGNYRARVVVAVPIGEPPYIESRELGGPAFTSNSAQAPQGECNCTREAASVRAPNDSGGLNLNRAANTDPQPVYTDTRPGCGGPDGGGGSGTEGGMMWCVTITTDHYEYDPNTDTVEYLKTTVEQFCTNMT